MKHTFFKKLLVIAMLVLPVLATADDTDLFVGVTPTAADAPNVLIILDNTANWNGAFTNEKAALVSVFNNLPADKFHVGVMMFTETGGGNSGNAGGYVRGAVRLMNSANRPLFSSMINSFDVTSDKSNGGKASLTMAEAYKYFAGAAPYAGNNKDKADYTGNVLVGAANATSRAVWALAGNALASKAATTYLSPVASGSCAKNFVIYISNGAASDNTADKTTATTLLTAAGGSSTAIPISPSGSQSNVADEWARFMKKSNLGIVTYTVDINKVTTGQGPGWTALLKSMAGVSSGKYFDVSASGTGSQISDALNKIFSEIQDVNSVFAAVSLPVSVNTQGTFLNQVYVGMFRPDPDAFPRWSGNLKQYKLGVIGTDLQLQDADSASAINSSTGFITSCARSFWTPSVIDNYWAFRPQGTCNIANSDASNYPDGNIVEKGAQAYQLRSTTTRTVNTCSATFASCTSMLAFNNTNVTQADLGAATTTERDELINWQKGQDIDDENINGLTTTETRSSVHGDIVHSRPVALNFGTDASPSVVVFYGANDGMLHAINGNRTASIGTVPAGGELWSFVAPEFFGNIKRIRDNTIPLSFFGNTTGTPTPQPKPYGFDGAITSLKTSTSAYIYATMRRGGRALYAFDVTTPASPSLKWKVGCPNLTNDTGCTSGFSGIGQTWSAPKPFTTSVSGPGSTPMIMMGGGYDTCEDADPNTCNTPKGNKVYVMNADTGTLLKTFDTDRSVVGDVFLVPDSAGFIKYGYATDTGGNIYRITMNSNSLSNWTMTKIASLGCSTATTCSSNRKFMFAPDVVQDGSVYDIIVGSGDREKPLAGYTNAYGVTNYFFNVQDNPTDSNWLSAENSTCGANIICLNSLLAIPYGSGDPTAASLATKKGWYLGLAQHEQVVTSAITVFDIITFSTQIPAVYVAGQCNANLGTATVYNVLRTNAAIANGTSVRGETVVGGGLSPSPVAGIVKLDDGTTQPFIIGGDPDSPLQGRVAGSISTITQPKSRVYWYIQQ